MRDGEEREGELVKGGEEPEGGLVKGGEELQGLTVRPRVSRVFIPGYRP